MLGAARLRMAVEEHGMGRQLVRFRVWPKPSTMSITLGLLLCSLAAAAAVDGAWAGAGILASMAVAVAARVVQECAAATGALLMPVLMEERAGKLAVVPKQESAAMTAAAHCRLGVRCATVLAECGPAATETAVGRKAG